MWRLFLLKGEKSQGNNERQKLFCLSYLFHRENQKIWERLFCMWHKTSVNVQEEYQDYSDIFRDGDLVEGNSLN